MKVPEAFRDRIAEMAWERTGSVLAPLTESVLYAPRRVDNSAGPTPEGVETILVVLGPEGRLSSTEATGSLNPG